MPSTFTTCVWEACKKIPVGKVTTYHELAHAIGTRAYRAVGNALHKNTHSLVPCHRVVRSDGSIGGFAQGAEEKESLLRKEGIEIKNGCIVGFEKKLYRF